MKHSDPSVAPGIPVVPPPLQLLFTIVAALLVLNLPGAALAEPAGDGAGGLTIRVVGDDWGAVGKRDVEAALYSVANALMPEASAQPARSIVVAHRGGAPVVLYDRGAGGEYFVLLHARDANWNLYVYEFAHEFCHIISNYDEHARDAVRRNQWFEESLCETASLYALTALATSWQRSPPTPRLADASRQLHWFFNLLMAEEHRRVSAGFAAWLHDSEDGLRHDPYRRRSNEVVAARLLPLFVIGGGKWDALRYLNLDPADNDCSLDEYLDHWYRHARIDQKDFIAGIRASLRDSASAPLAVAVVPR